MELIFNQVQNRWEAEFEANADFNLHIDGVLEGNISVFQRGTASGQYALVRKAKPNPTLNVNVYDYDFSSLVYPKFIKVSCATEPTYAEVTFASASSGGSEEGGGTTTKVADDVRFFDYDGTLLYAYSWEEAKNLAELPALPVHDGLEVREWNYTLDDILEQGVKYIVCYGDMCQYVGRVTIDGVAYQAWNATGDYSYGYWAYLAEDEPKEGDICYHAWCNNDDGTAWEIETDEDGKYYEYEITEVVESIGKVDVGACVYDTDGEQVLAEGVYIGERGITRIPSMSGRILGLYSIPVTVDWLSTDTLYNSIVTREIRVPKNTNVALGGYNAFVRVLAPNFYWNGARKVGIQGISPLAKMDIAPNISILYDLPLNGMFTISSVEEISSASLDYNSCVLIDFSGSSFVPYLDDVNNHASALMIVVPDELYDEWIDATNWSDISEFIYRLSEVPWIKE